MLNGIRVIDRIMPFDENAARCNGGAQAAHIRGDNGGSASLGFHSDQAE
jgi:hypothetical protein